MKKMSAFILSLLLVFSAFPNIQAAEKLDWIDHHFSIELQIDGEWKQLEPVLYYSQENDVLADGLLMFHPIMEVIADIDVPTVTYYPEIDYRVSYD
ncbi:MAG: hypothetical protein IKN04_18025, partial [Clostridia bacterium]|nr:hypothetical protein [Clostridia bacterium]